MPAHLATPARAPRLKPIGVLCMALGAGLLAFALLGDGLQRSDDGLPLERSGTDPTVLGVTLAPDATYPIADAATPATFGEDDGDSPTGAGSTDTADAGDDTPRTATTRPGATTSTTGQATTSSTTSSSTTTTTTAPTTTTTTEPTTTTTAAG